MERRRRFQTRQQYAQEKQPNTLFNQLNKRLNLLIALVAIAIVVTLFVLISGEVPKDEAQAQPNEQAVVNDEQPKDEPSTTALTEDNEEGSNESAELVEDESENTALPSDDPIVEEAYVNENWQAYPTKQTGVHESIYEKGHIDYEEKLQAIFSVLDLQQHNSIVLSVKNNGSTTTSIAVVTSMDKTQKYRVSIEWIDGEGWKPMRLEVLNSLNGAY